MINYLFYILFTSAENSNSVVCGNNPSETIYISDENDVSLINNCNIMNSSIYIHGENNIFSIEKMSSITEILGDLVISDTTELKNLAGLKNLERVLGLDLYLDTYSIVIRDNPKLGFTDTINWTKLTSYPFKINNNSINVECYETCNGCFGPGPYLCQECINISFWDSSVCVNECFEFYNESKYCHRIPPMPMIININSMNSTNLNFTWNINPNESYPYLINGVDILFNGMNIYNYNVDSTGYIYSQNFNETFEVYGLYPNTSYDITGMLFGNELMSNHTNISFTTPDYILPNNTDFLAIQNTTNELILLLWNEIKIPPVLAFNDAYIYSTLDITSIDSNTTLSLYNNTKNYKIINYENFNLTSGDYIFALKSYLYAPMLVRLFENNWYYDTFTLTTASTTASTTATYSDSDTNTVIRISTTTSSILNNDDDNNDVKNTLLIVIYVILAVLLVLLCIYGYYKYQDNKRKNTLSRLTGRNRNLEHPKPVSYANTVYDPTELNEMTTEVGSPTAEYFSRDALNNPNYQYRNEDNYYDC